MIQVLIRRIHSTSWKRSIQIDLRLRRSCALLAVLTALLTPTLPAQSSLPHLTVTSESVPLGHSSPAISVLLDNPFTAQGWAYGICHDPAMVIIDSVELGAVGSTVNEGDPPDFFELGILADSWWVAVVISITGSASLPPGNGYEIGSATYTGIALGPSALCPCSTSANPPAPPIVVYSGASFMATFDCGTIDVVPAGSDAFRRGDVDVNGVVDLGDPILILNYLFGQGVTLPCIESADVDNSDPGASAGPDIGDAIYLLLHLFAMGSPPPNPYPDCEIDPLANCQALDACL